MSTSPERFTSLTPSQRRGEGWRWHPGAGGGHGLLWPDTRGLHTRPRASQLSCSSAAFLLAKFYSRGQIGPVRGLAPKPARAFRRCQGGRAESGPAPRDSPPRRKGHLFQGRVNVILRYLCIAVANLSSWE